MDIKIFYGSHAWFQNQIKNDDFKHIFLEETIKYIDDTNKWREYYDQLEISNLIISGDAFKSLSNTGLSIINSVLRILNDKIMKVYIQNPPKYVMDQLAIGPFRQTIDIVREKFGIPTKRQLAIFSKKFSSMVIGQDIAKISLMGSVYRSKRMKSMPTRVVLLYGPPGVGKTESIKVLAKLLNKQLVRTQMSMLQTNDGAEYLFGTGHDKSSLAGDLISRQSNYILFDEFDKVLPTFYNAFYQMFDESVFIDKNYNVDLYGATIFLTSNFLSEQEAEQRMGGALYSRLYSTIQFRSLDSHDQVKVVQKIIEDEKKMLNVTDQNSLDWQHVESAYLKQPLLGKNPRYMKNEIRKLINQLLIEKQFID